MGKIILFSPVGGTDPVSNSNCCDGALIHICRVYKPDEIYMYMSKYVLEMEKKDNRYLYCLEKLYERLGKNLSFQRIERPDLEDVQDFDYFYDDFIQICNDIEKVLDKGDRLLVNVSSGTPAMKSSLLMLTSVGIINADVIQVVTPDRSINEHRHGDYDVKMLWELNPDNQETFENRCKQIQCDSLIAVHTEAEIKRLVKSYDYNAAYETSRLVPEQYSSEYSALLEYAKCRLMVDLRTADKISKNNNIPSFVTISDPSQRKILEYALSWEIKYTKGEYADFLRAFTPLLLDLFIEIIKKQLGINVYDYCLFDKGYKWDKEKLKSNETTALWIQMWDEKYPAKFKFSYVISDHLIYIIKRCVNIPEITACIRILRTVEEKIRNTAAHEVSTITEKRIKDDTGYSCKEIISAVEKAFSYTSINVTKDDWKSYDKMNDYILSKIERKE